MTLEDHLKTAKELAIIDHYLRKIFFRCQKHYPKSSVLMKFLYKILPGKWDGLFSKIQASLDTVYQTEISQAQWEIHKDIYYNLDKRYREMNK